MTKVNKINSRNSFPLYHKSLSLYRRRLNNSRKNISSGESGKISSKELDPETGFYYYGARYLDPRTSRWLSGDPAIGEYLPQAPVNDEAKKNNGNLPGQGGVFNLVNLHVYHYAGNNPVKYVDPDGESNWPFGFTFDPIGEIKSFLSQFDPGLKLANIFNAASNGNQTAQAYSGQLMEGAARDLAGDGAEVASNLSMVANGVSAGASVAGAPHVAAGAAAAAFVLDGMALGLGILAEDEDKTKAAILSFGIDLGFKALGSKASPLAKFFPGWSSSASRYRNSTDGRFISNAIGGISNAAQAAIGITVGIEAVERNKNNE